MSTRPGRIGGAILVAALGIAAAVAVVVALPDGANQAGTTRVTDTATVLTVTNSSAAAQTSAVETSDTAVRIPSLRIPAQTDPTSHGTSTTGVSAETTSAPGAVAGAQTPSTQISTMRAPTSTVAAHNTSTVNLPISTAPAAPRTTAAPVGTTITRTTVASAPAKPSAPQQPTAPVTPKAPTVPVSAPAQVPKTAAARAPNFTIPVSLGNATQLITVTATSVSATSGILRAWQMGADGSWKVVFGPVTAWVGSAGIGKASETTSRTPLGTFTLTEAFGSLKNPGTALPYRVTGPNDWWVSDTRAASYNTWQTCAKASCPFNTGVSEHLQFIKPYYDYAVVMDVNRNPVVTGAGSAFFLHVSVGQPTAGCIAIDKVTLVKIMQWLSPAAHPRIATGIS